MILSSNTEHAKNQGLTLFLVFFVVFFSCQASHSQAFQKKENWKKVDFSKFTSNGATLDLARDVYEYHWEKYGFNLTSDMKPSAGYITLKRSKAPKDFIVLITRTNLGGECAVLGCEIQIFEKVEKKHWRLVLHAYANQMWIGSKTEDGYYNIRLKSDYRPVGADLNLPNNGVIFYWRKNKYISSKKLNSLGKN